MKRAILAVAMSVTMGWSAYAAPSDPCNDNRLRFVAARAVDRIGANDSYIGNITTYVKTKFVSRGHGKFTCLVTVTWADKEPLTYKLTVPEQSFKIQPTLAQ